MLYTAAEALASYQDYCRQPHNRVKLGLPGIDESFRGIAAGQLATFIARSGVGKTNFACNVFAANQNVPQIFFSLEMTAGEIFARLVAIHYEICYRDLEWDIKRRAPLTMSCIEDAAERFKNIYVVDDPATTVEQMRSWVHRAEDHCGNKVHLVSVDYLELINEEGRGAAPVYHVNEVARQLKELAKTEKVSVLALHQTGRESAGSGGKPLEMNSAKYGGDVQSDFLIGGYRPGLDSELDEYERYLLRHRIVIQFIKNRDGSGTGDYHYDLDPDTVKFKPINIKAVTATDGHKTSGLVTATPLSGEGEGEGELSPSPEPEAENLPAQLAF